MIMFSGGTASACMITSHRTVHNVGDTIVEVTLSMLSSNIKQMRTK